MATSSSKQTSARNKWRTMLISRPTNGCCNSAMPRRAIRLIVLISSVPCVSFPAPFGLILSLGQCGLSLFGVVSQDCSEGGAVLCLRMPLGSWKGIIEPSRVERHLSRSPKRISSHGPHLDLIHCNIIKLAPISHLKPLESSIIRALLLKQHRHCLAKQQQQLSLVPLLNLASSRLM